jgi:phosphoribosylformylglycinamidine synthase I
MPVAIDAPSRVLNWGIILFPGSNTEIETEHVLRNVLGQQARCVWHRERDLTDFDALILPGGFAHGDYLRSGAVARFSPIMDSVAAFAESGKPVLGICNGFQILLEANLLPGAMLRNRSQQFRCLWTNLRVENARPPFLTECRKGDLLRIPIAHGEGNYFADAETLARMETNGQVLLRYVDAQGNATEAANPNGSVDNIAGICNERGNVMGLMPHPERAAEGVIGSADGLTIFRSVIGRN